MQRAFFYPRTFRDLYRLQENDRRKRKYNRRIIEIKQGHFTPLILSTSGGMGPECTIFIKFLAKKVAQKKNQEQADVMRVLMTEIRFAVLKATLIAIREAASSRYSRS